jgi:hypothetical protein
VFSRGQLHTTYSLGTWYSVWYAGVQLVCWWAEHITSAMCHMIIVMKVVTVVKYLLSRQLPIGLGTHFQVTKSFSSSGTGEGSSGKEPGIRKYRYVLHSDFFYLKSHKHLIYPLMIHLFYNGLVNWFCWVLICIWWILGLFLWLPTIIL